MTAIIITKTTKYDCMMINLIRSKQGPNMNAIMIKKVTKYDYNLTFESDYI